MTDLTILTVRELTADRDLAENHCAFLKSIVDAMEQSEDTLSPAERQRLHETKLRLSDVQNFLHGVEEKLPCAIAKLSAMIDGASNLTVMQKAVLTEYYIDLQPLKVIGTELGLNPSAYYKLHTQARAAFCDFYHLPRIKDGRGRRKSTPSF